MQSNEDNEVVSSYQVNYLKKESITSLNPTHIGTHTQNRFTALLDFVQDYLGETAQET